VGEERRTPDDRTDELIAELRDRVRSLEEANRENRRIISSLTNRTPKLPAAPETGRREPARRRIRSSWWKEKYASAMVGMLTAFAVLAANGEENPLRVGGGEEQAGVPPAAVEPGRAPPPQPAPSPGPVGTEPVGPTDPARPTDPVR
jgi:hypothetical protein